MYFNHSPTDLLSRLLSVMENDIIPLTARGVAAGNKLFGAALLRKSDLSLVVADTNSETENPMWHGEIKTLKTFYEMAERPESKDLIFLSTHEPCTMCMSAITWTGFDNYFYFFSHEDSRDAFAIPHDLKIMKELYGLDAGGYRRQNAFWNAVSVPDLALGAEPDEKAVLSQRIDAIKARYDELSEAYQSSKDANDIPLN